MRYTKDNKCYNIPNEELDKLQAKLKISRTEAVDLWLADNGFEENEEQALLNEKAAGVARETANSDKMKKPRKPRTVKISEEKQLLFQNILTNLDRCEGVERENVTILTENKLIEVKLGEKTFKINITECRKPKNQ